MGVLTPSFNDVVFVLDSSAAMSGPFPRLLKDYLIPVLEHFNGGPLVDVPQDLQYGPVQYTIVKTNLPGMSYRAPCSYYPITCSGWQLMKWLKEIKFEGGLVEHVMNLSEGLVGVMEILSMMEATREPCLSPDIQIKKHCVLICNTPPLMHHSTGSLTYAGKNYKQMVKLMTENKIGFSIISPRDLPVLRSLFELAQPGEELDKETAEGANHALSPRHLVLLQGFEIPALKSQQAASLAAQSKDSTDGMEGKTADQAPPTSVAMETGQPVVSEPTRQEPMEQNSTTKSVGGLTVVPSHRSISPLTNVSGPASVPMRTDSELDTIKAPNSVPAPSLALTHTMSPNQIAGPAPSTLQGGVATQVASPLSQSSGNVNNKSQASSVSAGLNPPLSAAVSSSPSLTNLATLSNSSVPNLGGDKGGLGLSLGQPLGGLLGQAGQQDMQNMSEKQSGQTLGSSGQTFSSSGQTLGGSGQTFSSSGQTFSSSGQTFSSSGQTLSSSGQTFSSSGQTLNISGHFSVADVTASSSGNIMASSAPPPPYDGGNRSMPSFSVGGSVGGSQGMTTMASGGSTGGVASGGSGGGGGVFSEQGQSVQHMGPGGAARPTPNLERARQFAELAMETAKKEAEQRKNDAGMRPMPVGMQPPARSQVPVPSSMNPASMQQNQPQSSSAMGMGQGSGGIGIGQSTSGIGIGQSAVGMGPGMNQVRASIPGSMGGMQQQQQAPPTQVRPGLAPPSTSMPSTQPQIGGVATSVGGAGGTGGFPGTSNIPSSFGQSNLALSRVPTPPVPTSYSSSQQGTSFGRGMPMTAGQPQQQQQQQQQPVGQQQQQQIPQQNQPQSLNQPQQQQLGQQLNTQQQQQQQLRPITIWRGIMEIPDTTNAQLNQRQQINCQVTTTKNEILQDLLPQHWPPRMTMNTYPKTIFNSITQLIKLQQAAVRTVTFQFLTENIQSITMLRNLMTTDVKNFAIVQLVGTQNIPQCPIKALILVWNEKQKGFTGLIPLDQNKFVGVVKEVLFPYHQQLQRQRQQQQQQQQQQQRLQQQQQLAGSSGGGFSQPMIQGQQQQQGGGQMSSMQSGQGMMQSQQQQQQQQTSQGQFMGMQGGQQQQQQGSQQAGAGGSLGGGLNIGVGGSQMGPAGQGQMPKQGMVGQQTGTGMMGGQQTSGHSLISGQTGSMVSGQQQQQQGMMAGQQMGSQQGGMGIGMQQSGMGTQQGGMGTQQGGIGGQQGGMGSQQNRMGVQQSGIATQQSGMGTQQSGMGAQQSGMQSTMGSQQGGIGTQQSGMGTQQQGGMQSGMGSQQQGGMGVQQQGGMGAQQQGGMGTQQQMGGQQTQQASMQQSAQALGGGAQAMGAGGGAQGQPGQQMNKQAQMEKLMHILQMLARGNPQQQEQILQRMPHLSAEQKQQLLQKAQAMKQQMIQQQQQQQAQSTQQGFPGGGPGNMMGGMQQNPSQQGSAMTMQPGGQNPQQQQQQQQQRPPNVTMGPPGGNINPLGGMQGGTGGPGMQGMGHLQQQQQQQQDPNVYNQWKN